MVIPQEEGEIFLCVTQKPEALEEKIKKLATVFFFNIKLKDKSQTGRKCLQLK